MFRLHPSAFLLLGLLATCAAPTPALPEPGLGATATPAAQPTPSGPPPTPVCGEVAPAPPQYDLELALDYAAHTAVVSQAIQIVNNSGEAWNDLGLVVSANYLPGIFSLNALSVDGYPARYALDGVGLRVFLPSPLEPACRVTFTADFSLNLPRLDATAFGWRGSLGWTRRQMLLGGWYPTLVPYRPETGWLARPPAAQGEYETTETSHVAVRLAPTGETTDLQIAASAASRECPTAESSPQPSSAVCFELQGARHFALALSDQMTTATAATGETTIFSMFFPEHSTAGRQVLQTTRNAFALYGDRYGPVPYTWLAAVEADIPDGMEFSGLYLLGKPYYAEFDGSPQNYLTLLAAHETAHQWWYSLVGNDPAGEPWLDEALATYSEELYFEAAYPDLVEWWWQFRVWGYLPEGSLSTDIYASDQFRPYVNAVYLNGAQFLHALRGEAGDEAFFKFLRAYAERGAGRIVTADDFWQVYAEFGDAQGSAARAAYFGGR